MTSEQNRPKFEEGSRDGSSPFYAHDEGLFDQDEDKAGSRINIATGKPFDNSTENPESYGFTILSTGDHDPEDKSYDHDFVNDWLKTLEGLADAALRDERPDFDVDDTA